MSRRQETRQPLASAAMAHRTRPRRHAACVTSACALLVAVGLAGCGSTSGAAKQAALDPQVIKAGTLTVCTSHPVRRRSSSRRTASRRASTSTSPKRSPSSSSSSPSSSTPTSTPSSRAKLLNAGKCDVAVAGITITGERARVLDFSSPYFDAGAGDGRQERHPRRRRSTISAARRSESRRAPPASST